MPTTLPTGRPHQDPARQARHLLSNLDHRTAVTSDRKGDKQVRPGHPLPDPLPEAMPKFWARLQAHVPQTTPIGEHSQRPRSPSQRGLVKSASEAEDFNKKILQLQKKDQVHEEGLAQATKFYSKSQEGNTTSRYYVAHRPVPPSHRLADSATCRHSRTRPPRMDPLGSHAALPRPREKQPRR